jgi:2-iminobutanoate/2-iminopropanoate deaminase
MTRHQIIEVPHAPVPRGPYSPAVAFGQLLFVAGQGANVPGTDGLAGSDIATQTEQTLQNVATILEAGGSSLQHVLRCNVYLVDMKDFAEMNVVYARMFGEHRPARTTVQVSALPVPGLRVEIDCIAYLA